MKKILLNGLLASAFLSPFILADKAEAAYCREYNKTIRVNGHLENGYGNACLQPDGSWMIVNTNGNVDPFDDLRAQNVTIVAREQPVYYSYGPYYRPVTYYAPRSYYRRPAVSGFFFSFGNNDGWNHNRGRDRDWDHDNHRGHHGHH